VVLIFGWGHGPVDDRGEVVPVRCPNCHNDVLLHEIRSTKRVSLFFVPVMPYGTDEYLVCPICGRGMQIRPGHHSVVVAMRAATSAFRAGTIPEADYRIRTDAFWRSIGVALSSDALAATGGSDAAGVGPPVAGVPAGSSSPSVEASLAERLANLGRLHADGVLTDDEFTAAKLHRLER
jgi:hypothetical protein